MVVLVDTNVFIDYAEGQEYARAFFNAVKKNCVEVGVLEDVYSEVNTVKPNCGKIKALLNELNLQCQCYVRIKCTMDECLLAEKWRFRADQFGEPLDATDLRIVAVAKTREFSIFSRDEALKNLAREVGIKVL